MEPFDIRTPRLLLRPFRLSDAPGVFAYASDPEWSRFLPVPQPYEPRHAEEFVARHVLASWDTAAAWALQPLAGGPVFGGVDLRIDPMNGVGELGYSVARSHWNQGFMTEAASAVIAAAFVQWDLAKVVASADVGNTGSWRVMEKLGMEREGLLRSHRIIHGTRRDFVRYGVLREEWKAPGG